MRHSRGLAGFFVGHLGPAFQPVEGRGLLLALGADVRADGRVRQPVESGAKPQVVLAAGRPADRFQQVVRMELDGSVWRQAAVEGLGDLGRCPDQDVGVPDRRDAEFRVGGDFHPDVADIVLDRREARLLGQAEERPLHRVALVADRDVREVGGEQVGLMIALGREPFGHGLYPD